MNRKESFVYDIYYCGRKVNYFSLIMSSAISHILYPCMHLSIIECYALIHHSPICLSTHPFIFPYIHILYPSIHPSIYTPTNLFIHLPIYPSINPKMDLPIHSQFHLFIDTFIHQFIQTSIRLSISPFIYLSVHPSLYCIHPPTFHQLTHQFIYTTHSSFHTPIQLSMTEFWHETLNGTVLQSNPIQLVTLHHRTAD